MAAQFIFTMNRVGKVIPPNRHILRNISLSFYPGAKIGVLGLNGAGKSTLLKIMAGVDKDIEGEAEPMKGIKIGYLPQEPVFDPEKTVRETVDESFSKLHEAEDALNKIYDRYAEPDADFDALAKEQARLEAIIQAAGGSAVGTQLEIAAEALRLPPWDQQIKSLSGGERRRVAICRLLLEKPDMLLLDEPTNHLDVESILWLENFISSYSGTVIFISHDRTFIDDVATRIVELDRGVIRSYPGNYSKYRSMKEEELRKEDIANADFDRRLSEEEIWIRKGIKARLTRNEGRVKKLKEMRREYAERRKRMGQMRLSVGEAELSGKIVFEGDHVSKSLGGKCLIKDFSFSVLRGDKIAILGPNGAGKSTLIKMLLGEIQPDSGTIKTGTKLQVAYFDQYRDKLEESLTVRDNIAPGRTEVEIAGKKKSVISYLSDFLFEPRRAVSPVSALSGGEKNRLLLAKIFLKPCNLLVLDEPTNDLDMDTLSLLEEMITSLGITIIVVSHDRWFVDNVATETWCFLGGGRIITADGGYKEAEAEIARLREKEAASSGANAAAASTPASGQERQRQKRKLSYKEERELGELPGKIEETEKKISELQNIIGSAGFYTEHTPEEIKKIMAELDEANALDEQLTDRWGELEEEKERLESGVQPDS